MSRKLFMLVALCCVSWAQPLEAVRVSAARAPHSQPGIRVQAPNALLQQSHPDNQSEGSLRQAEALLALSESQNFENHTLALQTAQKALALSQTLADANVVARAYGQIARCYFARADFPQAIENYDQALRVWRDLNNRSEQAKVLIMLGFVEARKSEWQNAISFLTQAQQLIDENESPQQMGQISSGLADVFNQSGLPETGLIHYKRALEYYRRTPSTRDDAILIWSIGCTYYFLGNYPEALAHLQQALASAAPESLDAAVCHDFLGRVYISSGAYDVALPHLQSALAIYTTADNPQEAAQVSELLGQLYLQLEPQGEEKHYERARKYYGQALETFRKLSDRVNQASIYFGLGRLELRLNNLNQAEDYLRKSVEITEDMRGLSTSRDLTTAFSATTHNRYESYIECLMRKHKAQPEGDFASRAFGISEQARGRALAELLNATQTSLAPGLDRQLAEEEKSLRQLLQAKRDYKISLLAGPYKRDELASVDTEILRIETEYKRINETIQVRYPSYEQITQPDAWDLRQIQEQVIRDDQTLLLEYSLGSDRSYVWAVTRNGIKSYELPPQGQINNAALRVHKLLATDDGPKSGDELAQATRELAQLVLSPVAAELSNRRIIVVADGALHYIPFQILSPSAPDQPLVATNEVINALSASILGQLREETSRRQAPTKVLAAFGDPVFESDYAQRKETSSNEYVASVQPLEGERWRHALRDIEPEGDSLTPASLQPLFFAKRELANLRDVAGSETLMVTGFDATREKLATADLTKYAILHFATHGVLNPKHPENSGLFLSMVNREGHEQNGFVGLQDIYQLHAPVDLVVLSACRTGLGKDVRGEGLIGLTRGFMYAGASSVVASLWKVDDEATAELMKEFYTNMLQRDMPPASALRAAQNTIRLRPQWRSPYYWAAFTLQGEFSRVIKPASATWISGRQQIILGFSLLLFLAAAAWYWRTRVAKAKNRNPKAQ